MFKTETRGQGLNVHEAEPAQRWAAVDWLGFAFSVGLVAIICVGQSGMKRFWYDELVTLRIAGLQTLGSILSFYESGKDTTSFLPAMLVHAFQRLPGKPELVTRLPFTIAYVVTCACIWIFVRRRYSAGFATAAALLFPQGSTLNFASETRAYAFVMMGAAIAVVCWQGALRRNRWSGLFTLGVFCGLATAILFHFFAIFLLVPFAATELYYQQRTGRLRWGMWAAILLYPATLAVMLPNMLAAHNLYGKSFWAKPTLGLLTDNYVEFIDPLGRDMGELVVLIAIFLWLDRRRRAREQLASDDMQGDGYSSVEWMLLIGVTLVPFVAFIGAKFLGVYRTQYLLYFQVYAMLLAVGGLAEVLRRRRTAGWAFAVVMCLLFVIHERDRVKEAKTLAFGGQAYGMASEFDGGWVKFLQGTSLPIVAEGSNTLLIAQHYAPELNGRIVTLTDHQRAMAYPHAMTNELNMELFGPSLQLPVRDYSAFVAEHPQFLLLVNPEQEPFTWLIRSLLQESATRHDVHLSMIYGMTEGSPDQVFLVQFDRPVTPAS